MPGLLRGVARTAVIAGTATHVSNNVSRRQARRWNEQPEQPAPQATPATDPMQQLQQLGELHAQGILTDEEFASKKQQLLSQM
jgi:hypothetical protein